MRRNAEPNEEVRGKVPIGVVSRLRVYMEAKEIHWPGEVLTSALDSFLKAEGF